MNEHIILILDNKLKIKYIDQLLPKLRIDHVDFINELESDFIGFYDWLRESDDVIKGVRLVPFDFAEEALTQIPNRPYIQKLHDYGLELYFTDEGNYVDQISCDQDIGRTKLYKSGASDYAIGFNIKNLSFDERRILDDLITKENR
jgi:hypothetical protein